MPSTTKKLTALSLLGIIAACTGQVSLGQLPSAASGDKAGDGSSDTGPYGITCEAYFQPAIAEVPQIFTARSDEATARTIAFPSTSVELSLAPAADSAGEMELTVATPSVASTQVYRLAKTRRPIAQFAGGHGFTGLVYVGSDIQYFCRADGAVPPPAQRDVTPVDAVCQVELRTTPGGAVERREIHPVRPATDPFASEPAVSVVHDDFKIAFTAYDSEVDSRSIYADLQVLDDAGIGRRSLRQLFQFDRRALIYNQLAGTTFSGRVAMVNGANKELSYACSARVVGDPCPAAGDVCGAGCAPGEAIRIDPQRNCRLGGMSVVTCQAPVEQTTDAACLVRSDGVVVIGSSSLQATGAFTRCDETLSQKVSSASADCASLSTGPTCANTNGKNTCDMSRCAADEECFTQVSCGPAQLTDGGPDPSGRCTLGDSAPADNTCHKTCSDSSMCPSGQQCVKKVFFGCRDYNGPAEGRGICMAQP